jgi:very-short-patch-repair endonuclease
MRPLLRTVDNEIADIAFGQHGVVTRRQLLDAGISPGEIKRRRRSGALRPVHRGVYRVGHEAPHREATYMAAVLACGDGAVLCGMAAAHLLGLVRGREPVPEVMAPLEHDIEGVSTRRWRRLDPGDTMLWRGIPTTTPARTVVDLAADLDETSLARVWHEADVRFRTTPRHVEVVLALRRQAPGARKLRRVLYGDVRIVLSELERAFLVLLGSAGLPLPRTNIVASGRRVDCRWRERRLTVELDSYRYHASRHAWEQDRTRERLARKRGDEHRRFSYDEVMQHQAYVVAEMRRLLRDDDPG